jgi:hypothetical protein
VTRPAGGARRFARCAAASALVAGAAACASFGGARPAFAPLPDAEVFASPAAVNVILTAVADSLTARGIGIQALVPAEGYLETGWFDLRSRTTVREPFAGLDQVVKLRLFVDPVGLHTRVIAESARRTRWDPSAPPRDLEVMVAADHAGRLLMDSVLAGVPRGTRAAPPASTRTPND